MAIEFGAPSALEVAFVFAVLVLKTPVNRGFDVVNSAFGNVVTDTQAARRAKARPHDATSAGSG